MWDKNRPTRMIPRAEVYTSGDMTVEELRGEGDEPKLTAEALAERIGESLPRTTRNPVAQRRDCGRHSSSRTARSLRCCSPSTSGIPRPSSGSTTASAWWSDWRLATERTRTGDELGVTARRACSSSTTSTGICLSLDGPDARSASGSGWRSAGPRRRILVVGPGVKTGHPDPLRRPARGRARPDRQLDRRAGAVRRAGDRRRLRDVDQLRRRLACG